MPQRMSGNECSRSLYELCNQLRFCLSINISLASRARFKMISNFSISVEGCVYRWENKTIRNRSLSHFIRSYSWLPFPYFHCGFAYAKLYDKFASVAFNIISHAFETWVHVNNRMAYLIKYFCLRLGWLGRKIYFQYRIKKFQSYFSFYKILEKLIKILNINYLSLIKIFYKKILKYL